MHIVLSNNKFENVSILDISILKSITEITTDTYTLMSLSECKNKSQVEKHCTLLKLSFSYGIIEDILVGMPKAIFNAINSRRSFFQVEGYEFPRERYNEIKPIANEIDKILENIKTELHDHLAQAQKDANWQKSNEIRWFYTEERTGKIIAEIETIFEKHTIGEEYEIL